MISKVDPRLCQVLGVEPMEIFGYPNVQTKYRVNDCGEVEVQYGGFSQWGKMSDQTQLQLLIANGVLKKTKITQEQLRDLTWLHDHFRVFWLGCDHDGVYVLKMEVGENKRYLIDIHDLAHLFLNHLNLIDILEAIEKGEV